MVRHLDVRYGSHSPISDQCDQEIPALHSTHTCYMKRSPPSRLSGLHPISLCRNMCLHCTLSAAIQLAASSSTQDLQFSRGLPLDLFPCLGFQFRRNKIVSFHENRILSQEPASYNKFDLSSNNSDFNSVDWLRINALTGSEVWQSNNMGVGGSPAFCRSLHQIGQCGSGKMRHNAAKCFFTA